MNETVIDNSAALDMVKSIFNTYNIDVPTQSLEVIGGIILIFVLVGMTLFTLTYIFSSIGISKLAKSKGYDKPWLAWIPVANSYLIGKLAFDNNNAAWGYLAYNLLCLLTNFYQEGFISFIAAIVFNYYIFKRFSNKYIGYTILNVLTFGIAGPFILFGIRNNNEIKN